MAGARGFAYQSTVTRSRSMATARIADLLADLCNFGILVVLAFRRPALFPKHPHVFSFNFFVPRKVTAAEWRRLRRFHSFGLDGPSAWQRRRRHRTNRSPENGSESAYFLVLQRLRVLAVLEKMRCSIAESLNRIIRYREIANDVSIDLPAPACLSLRTSEKKGKSQERSLETYTRKAVLTGHRKP